LYDDATGPPVDNGGVSVGLGTISVVLAAVVFATDGPMDFIERYLGFSPDGGDGSMEILVAMMLVVIVVVIGLRLATSETAT